ncbi:MAG: hypothetical protein ACXWC6_04765 [Ramlibacter sp.]
MSKKQDHLRDEQSRDKHPERLMKGSAADLAARGQAKGHHVPDHQEPHTGKVANDRNKAGASEPTQTHQSLRTPESRNDRESHMGGHNQTEARTGGRGTGRKPDGAG